MIITISHEGTYDRHGCWVPTDIEARDDGGQTVTVTRDNDETYVVESKLHGDETPEATGDLSLEAAWIAIGEHFGVFE